MLRFSRALLRARPAAVAPPPAAAAAFAARADPGADGWRWGALGAMAAAGAAAALASADRAENCGIVAVVGSPDAREFLLEGLTILQNRGYDSAGLATLDGETETILTTKYASRGSTSDSIDLLKSKSAAHAGHHVGIAHTRWATHGGKTDQNAHPHTDYKDRIALVHNGTLNNSEELREELQALGIPFKSETDTEVIAQMIGHYMDGGADVQAALQMTLTRLSGAWGLCVMAKDRPGELLVARHGSPLVIGVSPTQTFVASETTAFNRHTKQFIALEDGEVVVVRADGAASMDMQRVEQAEDQHVELSPAPYPHWTIRELMEQPRAIAQALNFGARLSDDRVVLGGLDREEERMTAISNLMIAACGTSLHAGMYGARLMRELRAFETVQTVDAGELSANAVPTKDAGVCVISQSGETADVAQAVEQALDLGVPVFSVINAVGSHIARLTRLGVYLNAGREQGVASTKAFSTQVTVMALLACWFAQHRADVPESKRRAVIDALQRLPISFGMALRTREQCKAIAQTLVKSTSMFVLGKGYGECIAREGALKIKEITYCHAEGYSGSALKHGPFAVIADPNDLPESGPTPVILLCLDDENRDKMASACEQVSARGARPIVITDNPAIVPSVVSQDDIIAIPNNGPLTALIATCPMQLIAYELAVLKGYNPDAPRNLAKSVTVE